MNLTTASLESLKEAEVQHRLLVQPLLNRDVAEARKRIEEHIEEAHERALKSLH
jgi:DNA-binding GntR family transcriptional regulator